MFTTSEWLNVGFKNVWCSRLSREHMTILGVVIRHASPAVDGLIIIIHGDLDLDRAAKIKWISHVELTVSRKMLFDAGDIAETIPIQQVRWFECVLFPIDKFWKIWVRWYDGVLFVEKCQETCLKICRCHLPWKLAGGTDVCEVTDYMHM